MGDFAVRLAALGSDETIARVLLDQMDDMFGTADDPSPASSSFVRFHVKNWRKDPWIRGGYSNPSMTATPRARAALSAPVDGRIFFGGEATQQMHMSVDA